MKELLSEEALIEYVKPVLKLQGFKKKGKRWTKALDEFTLVFFIQGSIYDKDAYYVRPGVYINACVKGAWDYYGHFSTDIRITDAETVLNEALMFFSEWTDKELIVKRARAFIEWERRNPLEKRRAGLVDYDNDPCPSDVFFCVNDPLKDYILNHL